MPVKDYIDRLASKKGKDNRINYNKIIEYLDTLSEYGLMIGEPRIKHLSGDIWELRPIRNRILFAVWDEENQGFILLHCFIKQTQKTPRKEIDTAKRRLQELKGG
jgi:phage-related protein